MDGNTTWFDEPHNGKQSTPKQTAGDRILEFVGNLPMFYSVEVSDGLQLDPRTVSKWLKRLVATKQIKRIDTTATKPSPAQTEYINKLRAAGLQTNHFKNAKWYQIMEMREQ